MPVYYWIPFLCWSVTTEGIGKHGPMRYCPRCSEPAVTDAEETSYLMWLYIPIPGANRRRKAKVWACAVCDWRAPLRLGMGEPAHVDETFIFVGNDPRYKRKSFIDRLPHLK